MASENDCGDDDQIHSLYSWRSTGTSKFHSWNTKGLYRPSDFDATHQINGNWVYHLPLGRGKFFGANWNQTENALLGGWHVAGLVRWTSGYPFSISTYAVGTN